MAFFNRQGEVTRRDWVEPDRGCAHRRYARSAALVAAAICLCLGACGVWAAGPRGTPEKPELYYWYLNTAGPGPELGVMDARVIALAEALGDNRIEECRALARALAGEAEDPEIRRQAVEYVIESYLAEGDFAQAREAAKGLSPISSEVCDAMLTRVNQREATYHAEVRRLQEIVAKTLDPEEAARAEFWTGHVHQGGGNMSLALQSYGSVIAYCRSRGEAHWVDRAIHHSILVMDRCGEDVERFCRSLVSAYPDSYPVCRAALSELAKRTFGRGGTSAASAAMADMRAGSEEETVCAIAQLALADVYVDCDVRAAESLLTEVKLTYPDSRAAQDARATLAQLYLDRGVRRYGDRSYLAAAQDLERAVGEGALGVSDGLAAFRMIGLCYQATDQTARALSNLEQALALATSAEERADVLYQIAVCFYRIGEFGRAREQFAASLAAAPQGPLAAYARERIAQCEEMLAAQETY